MHRAIGPRGTALIKRFEGCARRRPDGQFEAYPDPGTGGKPWTSGWGATGPDHVHGGRIGPGTIWSQQQCDARLARDLVRYANDVSRAIGSAPTTQGQFDALVSFVFNVGQGAFADSTLLRLLNSREYIAAEMQFQRWNLNDGKVMPGLTNRRKAEAAMFSGAAPITESKPTWEAPMSPFLIAALPALVEAIPGLIRNFGKGEVTERNAQAAGRVLEIVQVATGTANAQAAVEAVKDDPAARTAATDALDREGWFAVTESGGGGIEGARKFSIETKGSFWAMPAFWVSILLLAPLYVVVYAVLFQQGWPDTIKVQVVTAILAVISIVGAFWLGSSFAQAVQRNREIDQ
jgi:GH24 family phage-related lysozyme (muramidase)